MSTLAITDALLLLVTLSIAVSAKQSPSIRIAAGLFASAAVLGVLRFSGLLPLPTLHSFFFRPGRHVCVSLARSVVPLFHLSCRHSVALRVYFCRYRWSHRFGCKRA